MRNASPEDVTGQIHRWFLKCDDNPTDTASALRGFSRDGRPKVHVIPDGSQALAFLLSSQTLPKVVILDLDLQGGQGLETLGDEGANRSGPPADYQAVTRTLRRRLRYATQKTTARPKPGPKSQG